MDEEQLELEIEQEPEPATPEPEEQEQQMADQPTVKTGSMGDSADDVRTKTAEEPKVHVVGRLEAFRITKTNTGLTDEQRELLEQQERR